MAAVRPLSTGDIPAVAQLFSRVYPASGWASQAECEAYFQQMFFANPWVAPQFPSWVAFEDARAVGFIGVMPRPMRLRHKPVLAAVVTQLMVERENRYGVVAAQLLRKAMAGPQALTISDGANETSRKMWEALGGRTSTLYSLQWRRLLRPAQSTLQRASSARGRAAALLATPVAVLADACNALYRSLHHSSGLVAEPLETGGWLEDLRGAAARAALSPDYDFESLDWLLAQVRAKRRHGELQALRLRRPDGAVAGWFLYYQNESTSKVLQLHAREDDAPAVLDHLFNHAWRGGAAAIEGRMEPHLARALGRRHCLFHSSSVYSLIHSRDADLLAAFAHGDAFFSRLEGEWWMRFIGEPRTPAPRAETPAVGVSFKTLRSRQQPALP